MKRFTTLIIIASFVLQLALGIWNIEMIFFDAAHSSAETAALLGLIFAAHGLSIYMHNEKNPWKSYSIIVFGYWIASILLSLQDQLTNWYVTGMGGISLLGSITTLIWPAVVSLATLIALQRNKILDKKQYIKRGIRYFISIWTLLILLMTLLTSNIPASNESFIDFLISPLFLVFYMSFGVGAIIGGGVSFLGLSLYFKRVCK